jgi:CRP-like cAMP-binding protein
LTIAFSSIVAALMIAAAALGIGMAWGARRCEYQANEMVVLEGEAQPGLYYLEYGWLKVVKISPAGREQTLRFLEPGETFNEIGVFTKS